VAAAVVAGVVAFVTRSTLWTLGVGMAALWAFQWLALRMMP
jgi:branched-subunit amino acid transport protein